MLIGLTRRGGRDCLRRSLVACERAVATTSKYPCCAERGSARAGKSLSASFLDATRFAHHKYLWPETVDKDTIFVVEPDLDFRDYFRDVDDLYEMLQKRRIGVPGENLKRLGQAYDQYCELARIVYDYKQTKKQKSSRGNEIEEMPSDMKLTLQRLHDMRSVIAQCLALPNPNLQPSTPVGDADHYKAGMLDKRDFPPTDTHVNWLRQRQLTAVRDGHVYMAGSTVDILKAVQSTVVQVLRKQQFAPIWLPFLVRPAIVDACCEQHKIARFSLTDDKVTEPADENLVVVGNCLSAYGALLCRKTLGTSQRYPAKWYSIGNTYSQVWPTPNLHHSAQHPVITLTVICDSAEQCAAEYRALVDLIKGMYIQFHLSQYLAFDVSARHLRPSESARTAFVADKKQMNPIAHVACLDDFISRRIRLTIQQQQSQEQQQQQQQHKYAHMVYARINLDAIIADYIINKPKVFDTVLKEHNV